MYNDEKIAVIIASGGRGSRMGNSVPKQYLKIGGESVILRTLRVFQNMEEIDSILIAADSSYQEYCRELAETNGITKVDAVVSGGVQRQDSVHNALREAEYLDPGTAYVLVHDAARPFVTETVVRDVIRGAFDRGAAVPCVAVKDSLRETEGGRSRCVDRSRFFAVQTPQGFRRKLLDEAYEKACKDGFSGTDDASLVERLGYHIEIVHGDYDNIKITTKEDLPMENRIGTGFDVHRLVEGRKLILGGVEIPYEKGLDGHSDADVLIHALMDAMLGAAAMGDIGKHFPDTDDEYKGISSMKLLEKVNNILAENMYSIGNADITVIAQKPKLSPYTEKMRENIADVLGIGRDLINIKATTTEKLGFTGRGEGIAAEAVCSIYR